MVVMTNGADDNEVKRGLVPPLLHFFCSLSHGPACAL
jgi:hypothetical protein